MTEISKTDDTDDDSRVQKLSDMLGGDDGDEVAAMLTGGDGDDVPQTDGEDGEDGPREVVHTVAIDMAERVGVYEEQRHRNGDVTVVLLMAFGDGYQALALDVDAGGQLLEVEEIGDAEDDARAASMVEYWLDANPDGVLGGGGGGGVLDALGFGGDA